MNIYWLYANRVLLDEIQAWNEDEALEKARSWYPYFDPEELWVTPQ